MQCLPQIQSTLESFRITVVALVFIRQDAKFSDWFFALAEIFYRLLFRRFHLQSSNTCCQRWIDDELKHFKKNEPWTAVSFGVVFGLTERFFFGVAFFFVDFGVTNFDGRRKVTKVYITTGINFDFLLLSLLARCFFVFGIGGVTKISTVPC